ncbi:MAG: hypothetical protein RIQ41_177 [Candidatus Parcubacteria bacterium]|jgi:hypothetical protein
MTWTVVKYLSMILVACIVPLTWFLYYIDELAERYVKKLDKRIRAEKKNLPTNYAKEWYELSWARNDAGQPLQPNPARVIALAEKMVETDREKYGTLYHEHKHMTSSYYSQIKYLLRNGDLVGAYVFFKRCYQHRDLGLAARETIPEKMREVGDLEVFYAPDFLLGRVPHFGEASKQAAFQALYAEWERLTAKGSVKYPLLAAIVGSKLYSMTKHESFRERAKYLGITRDMEHAQMRRIANHYGFADEEEFYSFLGI